MGLASPLESLAEHYSVVVVGSGYGGSIAASRLARAGQSVCLLERGREIPLGNYPTTQPEAAAQFQVDTPLGHHGSRTGLFDMRVGEDINVLVGCGLGGTSLINANVSLQADPRVFEDQRWPAALRGSAGSLEAHYRRAAEMLRPVKYPDGQPPLAKLEAHRCSAAAMGRKFDKVPINVTFEAHVNDAGVAQPACNLCGDCVSGCNTGAKNTTLMTYLPDAYNHGAEIFTCVQVNRVERRGSGWRVLFEPLESGREVFGSPPMFVSADIVVLAAGSLGSTEILLRSRQHGLEMSQMLGKRFTGNGDALGFAYGSDHTINGVGSGTREPSTVGNPGPCITSVIDARDEARLEDGLVIEEGVIPGALAPMLPEVFAAAATLAGQDTKQGADAAIARGLEGLQSIVAGAHEGAVNRTQTYLIMSHDDSEGSLQLESDRLRVRWPGVGEQPVFQRDSDALKEATAGIGGMYVPNPLWTEKTNHSLTTVHPLGGCVMADAAADGVTNDRGQVFCGQAGDDVYEGLYVCDGALLPRSVGVNPLLTISALAERNSELMATDRGWQVDYSVKSSHPPRRSTLPGLRFTETMKGFFSREARLAVDSSEADFEHSYRRAYEQGRLADSPISFQLTVVSRDVRRLIEDDDHPAAIHGTVIAPALSDRPLTVTGGHFNLFKRDPARPDARKMIYRMPLVDHAGRQYFFVGFKSIHDDGLDLWPDTTTLYVTIHEGPSDQGPVVGSGMQHILPDDFARQMTTLSVDGAASTSERLKYTAEFGELFAGSLFRTYGGVVAAVSPWHDEPMVRKRRSLRAPVPRVIPFHTKDGAKLRLTRYQGGDKGPVVLAPGFATNASSFAADTVDTNLVEFLALAGYDVWLFDHRSAPSLVAARANYTIDDIALLDWPAAIRAVREHTDAKDVQVVAHCIGSMTLLMSLLSGTTGVRSAVCAHLTLHPQGWWGNRIKSAVKLPSVLQRLGVDHVTTNSEAVWSDELLDQALRVSPIPEGEACTSDVCRRIFALFGPTHRHAQLNAATHDTLHEVFGLASVAPFKHLAEIVGRGAAVAHDGRDEYLPHVQRLALPLLFVAGRHNELFRPETSERTLQWLQAHNDPKLYERIVFDDYAHLDCFLGRNASRDIFPSLVKFLEEH